MIKKLEKAIRHFECMRDDNIAVLNSGFGTKKGEHNSLYKNRKMYAELAIEALEKQKPKKPRYTTIFEGEKAEKLKAKNLPNFEIYKCPICNNSVAERTVVISLYPSGFIKDNYCRHCGTKIDWSEVDG